MYYKKCFRTYCHLCSFSLWPRWQSFVQFQCLLTEQQMVSRSLPLLSVESRSCQLSLKINSKEIQMKSSPEPSLMDHLTCTLQFLHLTSCVFMKSVDTSTFYYLVIKGSHNFRINFQQEISCSTIQSSL